MKNRRMQWGLLLLVFTSLIVTSNAFSLNYNPGSLSFETSGQSMWGSGNAPGFDKEYFLGTSWDTPTYTVGGIAGNSHTQITPATPAVTVPVWIPTPSWRNPFSGHWENHTVIPAIPAQYADTRTGAEASVNTYGKVGFNVAAKADSGSVDATVNYDVSLQTTDRIKQGDYFSLNTSSALSSNSSFSTNFAEVSGKVEAVLGAKATLSGTGCVLLAGCASDSITIGFDPQTLELISFNDTDSPGEIRVLGDLSPSAFQFGEAIDLPPNTPGVNFGNVTINVPDIEVEGSVTGNALSGSGQGDLLEVKADIDGLILNAMGQPSTLLEGSIDVGKLSASYNLLDIEYGPTLEILQNFSLLPALKADLDFSRPVEIFGLGTVDSLAGQTWEDLPQIALLDQEKVDITPTFYLDVLFSNETALGIDGEFVLKALEAGLSIDAFGVSLDLGEIGPLFETKRRNDWFNLPPLFNEMFSLDGFGRFTGPTFTLQAFHENEGPAPVPEPSTMVLLGGGLLMIITRKKIFRQKEV